MLTSRTMKSGVSKAKYQYFFRYFNTLVNYVSSNFPAEVLGHLCKDLARGCLLLLGDVLQHELLCAVESFKDLCMQSSLPFSVM